MFNKLVQISMDNFKKIIIEKEEEKITIPISFPVGFFSYDYELIISRCLLDSSYFDVFHIIRGKVFQSGKIKEGSEDEEILFILKDIIEQLNNNAMRMTKIDFDFWKDPDNEK